MDGFRVQRRSVGTLILLRHGQSIWNKRSTFSGWCDVALTDRGRREAREAGELLRRRGYEEIDAAFTSKLSRAWETCELLMQELTGKKKCNRCIQDWRLNERHYGALQGMPKDSTQLIARYGKAQMKEWRRSLRSRPPPLLPHHPNFDPSAPRTESLADCRARALECYEEIIKPALFKPKKTVVLIVAHSNTLRGLISHFDDVADHDVPEIHVPNSVPIVYNFDDNNNLTRQKLAARGVQTHARWLLSEENQAKIVKALKPGGLLARALFEAWDADNSRTLDHAEIVRGLHSVEHDVALSAIARRIVRKLHFNSETNDCTRAEFDQRAAEVAAELHLEESGGLPPPSNSAPGSFPLPNNNSSSSTTIAP